MTSIVDLHGQTEQEAIGSTMSALLSLDYGELEELEIITGNGQTLKRVVEEILEEEGYYWYHENGNYGSYTVKSKY